MNLRIQPNSRQVPKVKEICANKKYYDILYSYLQCISELEPDTKVRLFKKKEINFSRLAESFNLSRQTVSTKFKNLKDLELVKERDKDTYELVTLENNVAYLIPYQTLKLLTDTLNENSISAYVYLLNRYYGMKCQPFCFSLDQIKAHIGICSTTKSNDNIVTNILYVLEKLGLIKYSLVAVQQKDNFKNIKTMYQLDWVTNQLDFK